MKKTYFALLFACLFLSTSFAQQLSKQLDSLQLKPLTEGYASLYYSNLDGNFYISRANEPATRINETYTSRFFEYYMRDSEK